MPAELLKFRCYRCNQLLAVAPSRAGSVVACPRCKAELQIPAGELASKAETEKAARRRRGGTVTSNAETSQSNCARDPDVPGGDRGGDSARGCRASTRGPESRGRGVREHHARAIAAGGYRTDATARRRDCRGIPSRGSRGRARARGVRAIEPLCPRAPAERSLSRSDKTVTRIRRIAGIRASHRGRAAVDARCPRRDPPLSGSDSTSLGRARVVALRSPGNRLFVPRRARDRAFPLDGPLNPNHDSRGLAEIARSATIDQRPCAAPPEESRFRVARLTAGSPRRSLGPPTLATGSRFLCCAVMDLAAKGPQQISFRFLPRASPWAGMWSPLRGGKESQRQKHHTRSAT